ncbi:hypothetical protein [Nitrosopumilus sp.]|uniref:hypothetical protein n=1 Tax=Nitrosopumilus sp. TaxID=2024843 RepID=UPI003B5CC253
MRNELFIIVVFSFLFTPSSVFASWHWSSPYEICGTEVIKKGEKCELHENEKSKSNTNKSTEKSTDAQSEIPQWIHDTTKEWSENTIDDESFVAGIHYLIKIGIIDIPETKQDSETSFEIPQWAENNARWWTEGLIDDESFVLAIQHIIKEGQK